MKTREVIKTQILEKANELVHGDRARAYGSAFENASAWARMFSAATGLHVRAAHYPICMICVKLARERSRNKYDNWVDIAGYVGVYGKMQEELAKMEDEPEEKDD